MIRCDPKGSGENSSNLAGDLSGSELHYPLSSTNSALSLSPPILTLHFSLCMMVRIFKWLSEFSFDPMQKSSHPSIRFHISAARIYPRVENFISPRSNPSIVVVQLKPSQFLARSNKRIRSHPQTNSEFLETSSIHPIEHSLCRIYLATQLHISTPY